jgi:uncharacterized protein (DUF1501 family)
MRGPAPTASFTPGRATDVTSRVPTILQHLYKDDPLLGPAFASGLQTEARARQAMTSADALLDKAALTSPPVTSGAGLSPERRARSWRTGATLGQLMMQEQGPQIAALPLDGFDTHARQGGATGQLAMRLEALDVLVQGLHDGLGAGWTDTVVVAVTEFGRTARVNGTGGTDHGTASAALLLGGALAPGELIGDWPTLADGRLFEKRDLAPTLDVRSVFKGVLGEHLGVSASKFAAIFPGGGDAKPISRLV